ncbi:two component transcriptional regulator, LytTR family [Reichenbachiella faecimaris]|uniref:Two component transcriptional regulator, LytTR family n=1 Tax=Reichenbachiella faecimaris TaxID=692418 RepID=A0A1W2G5R4_REIFA|nr:LytTR family DNA-binding domain-containing protein [Reichenbachiella faecimaris]SMD31718.1 two component transcriptional regulator, LytTR family [Reichenbachiella faecimaris]
MIKCVIIDDEYLARERLKKLLNSQSDVVVIGEARNGQLGVELIQTKAPDLVFLDIQMPDLDGFGVINKLDKIPYIVFTTAYDHYALKAFDIHALDYLLKPFDEDRLDDSLKLVQERISADQSALLTNQMKSLLKTFDRPNDQFRYSFLIKEKGFENEVQVDDVIYMETQGNYVKLVTTSRHYLFRIAMNILETELDPKHFVRIHRTYILNKNWIVKQSYQGNNEFQFTLKNGFKVSSSRSFKKHITAHTADQ